jgi:hypothetical protein
MGKLDGRLVILVDIGKILSSGERTALAEAGTDESRAAGEQAR